jgi:hypothetical protein
MELIIAQNIGKIISGIVGGLGMSLLTLWTVMKFQSMQGECKIKHQNLDAWMKKNSEEHREIFEKLDRLLEK